MSSQGGWSFGQLVRSKAGRDSGRYYLVLRAETDFLLVADGRRRPVENPKRKNIRHLQPVHRVAADSWVREGKQPSNEQVRAAIKAMLNAEAKEDE
ncbi:MAG: KOW domain-containing RNA-binding protein [Clostridia bacterium]|nr:KOW domain-containing RNA-binding protein [Clostridia bacterium]